VWRKKLRQLSRRLVTDYQNSNNVQKFRFVYRISLEDKIQFQLEKQNFRAFQSISSVIAKKMGVQSPAYPIFINDKFTPYNYGGLLNRI
jgi:pyoverdine/dityrosine biosynthesis protein Dit1